MTRLSMLGSDAVRRLLATMMEQHQEQQQQLLQQELPASAQVDAHQAHQQIPDGQPSAAVTPASSSSDARAQQEVPQLEDLGQLAAQNPLPDSPNICVFCQQIFGDVQVEALLCGHVFHTVCVDDYLSATNRSRANCRCPFKCQVQEALAIDVPPDASEEGVPAMPPVDEALVLLAELARVGAEANIN